MPDLINAPSFLHGYRTQSYVTRLSPLPECLSLFLFLNLTFEIRPKDKQWKEDKAIGNPTVRCLQLLLVSQEAFFFFFAYKTALVAFIGYSCDRG